MDQFNTPFGEVIEVRQVIHDSGVPLLRIKIIDGVRFSQVDIDVGTASAIVRVLQSWVEQKANLDG